MRNFVVRFCIFRIVGCVVFFILFVVDFVFMFLLVEIFVLGLGFGEEFGCRFGFEGDGVEDVDVVGGGVGVGRVVLSGKLRSVLCFCIFSVVVLYVKVVCFVVLKVLS